MRIIAPFSMKNMTTIETLATTHAPYTYSEADFDGHHAAPLLIVGPERQQDLIDAQDKLANHFVFLTESELASYAKPNVRSLVSRSITSRMHLREASNGMSYISRPNQKPDYSIDPAYSQLEVHEACENLKYGRGSVLQNELARRAFGMSSVEYANLTIIGAARRQLEPRMWEEVSQLVESDATPRPEQMYKFKVLEFDRNVREDPNISALRLSMKRRIGVTPDGAEVKARTTAIVKLMPLIRHMGAPDKTYQSFVSQVREIVNEHVDGDVQDEEEKAGGYKAIAQLPEFLAAVKWLVETNPVAHGVVLARNETVYGAIPKDK